MPPHFAQRLLQRSLDLFKIQIVTATTLTVDLMVKRDRLDGGQGISAAKDTKHQDRNTAEPLFNLNRLAAKQRFGNANINKPLHTS